MCREVFSGVKDKTNIIILTGEKMTAPKHNFEGAIVKTFNDSCRDDAEKGAPRSAKRDSRVFELSGKT